MTLAYKNALTEVFEIINHLNDNDYNKIPKDVINSISQNRNTNYYFWIDESKEFSEQDISTEAKALLIVLFRDYFATKNQKNRILNYQKGRIIKNNYDQYDYKKDIFAIKNDAKQIEKKQDLIKSEKKKWYCVFIDFLKRIVCK